MNIAIDDIITSILFISFTGLLMIGLMWAADREHELGINGMSSERILVKEEMKNH
jgi:hypothetical protein